MNKFRERSVKRDYTSMLQLVCVRVKLDKLSDFGMSNFDHSHLTRDCPLISLDEWLQKCRCVFVHRSQARELGKVDKIADACLQSFVKRLNGWQTPIKQISENYKKNFEIKPFFSRCSQMSRHPTYNATKNCFNIISLIAKDIIFTLGMLAT